MKKQYWIILGAVAAALLAIIFYVSSDPGSLGGGGGNGNDPGGLERRLFGDEGSEGFMSPRDLEELMSEGPTPKALYEAYRSYAQYPPNSRPLTREMKDMLEPWTIQNQPLPVMTDPQFRTEAAMREWAQKLEAQGKSRDEIMAELERRAKNAPRYKFDLPRHTITENETLTAFLNVTDAGGSPLAGVTILGAEIIGDVNFGSRGLGSAEYKEAGVGRYQFTWKPPSADKQYWGTLTLKVRARIPGLQDEAQIIDSFFSSPTAPARFTGQFSERLENGSLLIDVGVDVARECSYQIHGNLYSLDDNEPTHWAAAEVILKPGAQVATLTFFGKVFHDGGYEGRFELRDLRGTCENIPFPASWIGDPSKVRQIEQIPPNNEPVVLFMPYTNAKFATRSYRLSEFSKEEWSSPDKERRLQQLRADADSSL
jgi:hypothetical protein